MKKLYMPVTNDRFELPVGPAMPINELSEYLGIPKVKIWAETGHAKQQAKVRFHHVRKAHKIVSFEPGEDFNDG